MDVAQIWVVFCVILERSVKLIEKSGNCIWQEFENAKLSLANPAQASSDQVY